MSKLRPLVISSTYPGLPNEDRTHLLAETTEDLCDWLNQEQLTDLELAYWIPKYILMRGDKPFASLGTMSP